VTQLEADVDRVAFASGATLDSLRVAAEYAREALQVAIEVRMGQYLPVFSDGRHRQVELDQQLRLTVDGVPPARDGSPQGSRGLRSQSQLALLLAVGQELLRDYEPAPLLLDDVLSDTDPTRTEAILNQLRLMAMARQVVVFSLNEHVRSWADVHLRNDDRNRIYRLSTVDEAPLQLVPR
jgi:uncharacterized protein YhaN